MPVLSVIIHERLANWSRQLRPRFRGWPVLWSESRSAADLTPLATRSACPILVIGLDGRPARSLRDLAEALQVAPNALVMVIDPHDQPEVAALAREIGATIVLSGMVVPPEVEQILQRWLPLAKARTELEGWSALDDPEPEVQEIQDEPNDAQPD